ncbi:type IV secretion system DNA-binding domain-containing protein [Candidatus Wolfebacteria bacterium]|nr:type IV secretion system DNA-binding domain-containing protein [Candidatus Wolfebacteria bacterium]
MPSPYLILGLIAFVASVAVFFILRGVRAYYLRQSLGLKLLLVRLAPLHNKDRATDQKGTPDFKDEINLSAQLFSILARLKSPFALEAAVPHIGEEIHFYVAVPAGSAASVSREIEGMFKDAKVDPVPDYNIFNSQGISRGAYLKLKTFAILPLRTYKEVNVDTFAPILSGLSKIKEIGEGAAIQIIAMPGPESFKKSVVAMVKRLKQGATLEEVVKGLAINFTDVRKALATKSKEEKERERVIDDEGIKILQQKIESPVLRANIRIVASATVPHETESILESIAGGFHQFSAPLRNEITVIAPRDQKKFLYQFAFRHFDSGTAVLLNTDELASIFHFPTSTSDVPKVKWLKAKDAAPPPNLPKEGTLIGESVFRDEHKNIYITDDDRRRHVYTIGQTGTGKSTLLTNMVVHDIRAGRGVGIIDPHGDLVEAIIGLVPTDRIDDVIVFDPADRSRPLGLNMLEYSFNRPEEKTFIVNEMQNIFNKLFLAETMGPMFEQYMRNALLLLMEDAKNEPATLMEVSRVFTDADFRERKLARITNPMVVEFWEKTAVRAGGEASLSNMTPYITSKFDNFTANDYMRPIIGQPKSAFSFREAMDNGKILLVNLSKGKIGDINANLLGMVITGKILMAALSRADVRDPRARKDFNFYIDEFQNFSTDSIATILSEARKYGLNLTMAHQFIAQLEEKIRDAVFGNVGSMISFRIGPADAEFIVKQFEPVFSEADLINIDNFNAYAKILINGQTSKPFNMRTFAPEKGDYQYVDKIKELSGLLYGRDREEVEKEILFRVRN